MDKRIGAQFFTVRDFMKTPEDFDDACKKISQMGYKTVQISGTPLEAKVIREILDKYGLKAMLSHLPFDAFEKKLDWVIEYNKTIGADLCGLGMMPMEYAESVDGIGNFIEKANRICDALKKENMYFGYHNHSLEFAKIGGKTVFDILSEETDPEAFNFIVDTYWVQVGGKNPAKCIKKLGKRAMAVHFKDYKIEVADWGHSKMAEVGSGNLDWDEIIAACETAGTRWAFVEQDGDWLEASPFKSLEVSYEFLKTKGFI